MTFCVSKCAEIVTLPGGDFITIEKRPIEKDFCFGYSDSARDTEDYDRAQRMAHHAATHEEYFINENMEYYRDKLDALRGEGEHARDSWGYVIPLLRTSYINQPENSPLKTLELARLAVVLDALGGSGDLAAIKGTTIQIQGNPYRVCTDEERKLIIAGYERVANAHEKRIKTYLKRYGLTKVRTWSYWRDE